MAADTLRGGVTSADGRPLAGATARIAELGRSVTTNARGRFVLSGIPEGSYRLVVTHLGYESVVRRVRTDTAAEGIDVSLRACGT